MKVGDKIGHYYLLRELGENTYARVFAGRDLETAREVAVKTMKPGYDSVILEEETRLLRELDSDHVVRLLDVQDTYLVMELAEFSLQQYSKNRSKGVFSEEHAIIVAFAVLRGLEELHGHNVVHRGVSPTNILLYSRETHQQSSFPYHIALGDLSSSRQLVVLPILAEANSFLAPEIISGNPCSSKADIWSLGATLLWMLSGQRRILDTPQAVAEALGQIDVSEAMRCLLTDCLQFDPSGRPSADTLLRRSLFAGRFVQSESKPAPALKRFKVLSETTQDEMVPQEMASLLLQLLDKLQKMPDGLYNVKPSMILVDSAHREIALVNEESLPTEHHRRDLDLYAMLPLSVHDGEDVGSAHTKAWNVACVCYYVSAGVLPFGEKTLRLINKRIENLSYATPVMPKNAQWDGLAAAACDFFADPLQSVDSFRSRLDQVTTLPVSYARYAQQTDALLKITMQLADAQAQIRQLKSKDARIKIETPPHYQYAMEQYARLLSDTRLERARDIQCTCEQTSANLFQASTNGCLRCCGQFYGQAGRRDENNLGNTALLKAARNGFLPIVELLLGTEAGITANGGFSALMCAANWGHLDIVKLLAPWEKGLLSEGDSALIRAANRGQRECFLYLENVAEERSTIKDFTELMLACIHGDAHEAARRLDQAGKQSRSGRTALMFAAASGSEECVKLLLNVEAKKQSDDGETALFIAAWKGNTRIVELLAPLEATIKTRDGWTALMCAAQNGNVSVVEALAPLESGLRSSNGFTALMLAAQLNRLEIVAILAPKEARLQQPDGWTAMMWAASRGHSDVVLALAEREKGLRDTNGFTALQKTLSDGKNAARLNRCTQILCGVPEEVAALAEADALVLRRKFGFK